MWWDGASGGWGAVLSVRTAFWSAPKVIRRCYAAGGGGGHLLEPVIRIRRRGGGSEVSGAVIGVPANKEALVVAYVEQELDGWIRNAHALDDPLAPRRRTFYFFTGHPSMTKSAKIVATTTQTDVFEGLRSPSSLPATRLLPTGDIRSTAQAGDEP